MDVPNGLDATVAAMRRLGVVSLRTAEYELHLGPEAPVPAPMEQRVAEEPAQVRAEREKAEYEELLFASSEGAGHGILMGGLS